MAEIPALTAAHAFALQTDAQRLRDQQDTARARVDAQRQTQLDRQNFDAAAAGEAERLRLERQRSDIRAQDEARAQLAAEDQARTQRAAALNQQRTTADDLTRTANAFDQAAVDRQLELDRNALVGAPAPQPSNDTGRVARSDALAPSQPADNSRPPEATPSPDQLRQAAFQAQVAERDQRVADRRAAARDAAVQQQIDLQLSNDRIAQTLFNPELPRGSVVDVTG